VISGFRRSVTENCALVGHYAASSGNYLPTCRYKLSVLSSGIKNPKRKPVAPIPSIYIGKSVWAVKSLISVVSANRVVVGEWK
jgi:hypothetical protein